MHLKKYSKDDSLETIRITEYVCKKYSAKVVSYGWLNTYWAEVEFQTPAHETLFRLKFAEYL